MTVPPEQLINETLIPLLDQIGRQYETGEIFLPQLIRSAAAAKISFDGIRLQLSKQQSDQMRGEIIVLATVQGDIHDIGKNIVRAVLENYGYHIIDLGRDVPPQDIVDAAVSSKAGLVGLSALMTTTLGAMQDTISRLKEQHPKCKIVVGGAVLTENYAHGMGADFYAKDAAAAVKAAKAIYAGQKTQK